MNNLECLLYEKRKLKKNIYMYLQTLSFVKYDDAKQNDN